MDEEDGRTGPRSRQFGRFNAPAGVPARSLPQHFSALNLCAQSFTGQLIILQNPQPSNLFANGLQQLAASHQPPFTVHTSPSTKE
jgi:hypothetical protein